MDVVARDDKGGGGEYAVFGGQMTVFTGKRVFEPGTQSVAERGSDEAECRVRVHDLRKNHYHLHYQPTRRIWWLV